MLVSGSGEKRAGIWLAKVLQLFRIRCRWIIEDQNYSFAVYGGDMCDGFGAQDAWVFWPKMETLQSCVHELRAIYAIATCSEILPWPLRRLCLNRF